MALDNEMKAMQVLSKLDDETRERVLSWAGKKWTAGKVAYQTQPVAHSSGELPLVRKGG